jgi:hypothetical protein
MTLYYARIPLLVVFVVGIVLSATNLSKHEKRSTYSLIAFVMFLLHDLIMPHLWSRLPLFLSQHGRGNIGFYMILTGTVISLIMVIPWTLILISLFRHGGGRRGV